MNIKTEKELAFLRDLYIETDWTERFTDLLDENFKFNGEKNVLYANAGAGNHALALRKKLDETAEILGVSENQELVHIARHKADAVKSNTDFSSSYPAEKFDAVLADASLVRPTKFEDFLEKVVDLSKKQVAVFLPTASSFGEIFSLLWETLSNLDELEKGAAVERLIIDIPTVSAIEDAAKRLGLTNVETITKTEFFEFDDGEAFINSPLINDFLMPVWFEFLSETDRERIKEKLAETIDEDCQEMSFRFSVKTTLLVGEKSAAN